MQPPPIKTPISALTATRAIAAILVFIHHFGAGVFPFSAYPNIFRSGNIAVGYFFVLSGFVLYISYCNKQIPYRQYIIKRIGRIVPIYLLALMLTTAYDVVFLNYDLHTTRAIKEIVFSALFIQSYIPSYPLTLNLPGWTISIELFFYILFPLFLVFQKKYWRFFVVFTTLLFLLSQVVHLHYYPLRQSLNDNLLDFLFFNPVIHLSQFLIGMIGGYLYSQHRIKAKLSKYRWLPFALFIIIILIVANKPADIGFQVGLLAPLFMFLIVGIAITNYSLLNIKPLLFLGNISYGIYILQYPIGSFLGFINNKYFHFNEQYLFYGSFVVLIMVASITYYTIELPIMKRIRQ